jgi:WD40 repeat protein
LIDFGAVKQVSAQTTQLNGHTSLTIAIGSPGYMPNEQLAGKPQLCSDIYAVGMLGIQALTGLPPTQLLADPKTSEILWRDKWRHNTPREQVQASPELAEVLDKMVRYDYRQRYQTATEALQALQSVNPNLSTQPFASPTPSLLSPSDPTQPIIGSTLPPQSLPTQQETKRRQSRPLIKVGASIATAIALTIGIYYFQKTHSLREQPYNVVLDNTLPGHASGVTSLAISPDGQILASGSLERTIKIRNLRTKELVHTLTGHTSGVISIAISPDGQTLVSGSNDQTIKVWNLRTGQLLRTLSGHSDYVSCLAISSDNQTLVSGSNDQTIKVWNLRTGQLLRNLEPQGYSNGVGDVAVSLDGQTLVSSDSSDIKLWNLRTGQLLRTLEGHKFPVRDLVMSSKGETFASGSLDGSAKMWNLRTGQLLNNFPHGSGEPTQSATTEPVEGVYAVAISPDSQTLITGSGGAENSLKIWKVRTAEVVRTLKGHSKAVFSLVMSPDGQTIYSGSMDGTIKVWRSP